MKQKCSVCKEVETETCAEAMPGVKIYVCDICLEVAKDNFIFICMTCDSVYIRPKKEHIKRIKNFEMKRAYMLCEDKQIIQGIDMCIKCNPEGIVEFVRERKGGIGNA